MAGITRPYYYQGQFLGAEDFNNELAYHRDMRRRHNLAHHTHGLVVGLALAINTTDNEAYVMPGMAIDGYGREILVLRPRKLSPADFAGMGDTVEVWIRYDEEETSRTESGYELCDEETRYERLRETFRIVPANDRSPQSEPDSVVVDGQEASPPVASSTPADITIPSDLSTPYQDFPADEDTYWHLRLGTVTVDLNGRVTAVNNEARRWISSVSHALLAPEGKLTLKNRALESPLPDVDASGNAVAGVEAVVEGSLTVNRDINADQDVNVDGHVGIGTDADPDIPLTLGQTPTTSGGSPLGTDIWLRAGDGLDDGRAWIEYGEQGAPTLVLSDKDDPPRIQFQQTDESDDETAPDHASWIGHGKGKANVLAMMPTDVQVGIGTADPQETLEVAGSLRVTSGDINSHSSDLTLQTGGSDRVTVKSGTGNVGIGTSSPQEALHVAGAVRGDETGGALRVHTEFGYVDIGPRNASWAHFETDRDRFYFNKEIRVNSGQIGSYNEDLSLRTSGATKVTIRNDSDKVGIGTNDPDTTLHIAVGNDARHAAGTGYLVIGSTSSDNLVLDANEIMARNGIGQSELHLQADGGDLVVHANEADNTQFLVQDNGHVAIGRASASHPLHMDSGARCTAGGVWTNASSIALKQDVQSLSPAAAIEALRGLSPITFRYKAEPEEAHVGFIAEEVPDLVAERDRTGLSPMDIVGVLTKVVQQQQEKIESLLARLDRLEEGG